MMIGYKTMIVRVIGIGLRKTGETATGKKYDFVPVVLAFEDKKNFEGERAVETVIDGNMYDETPFILGDALEVAYIWYKDKNGNYKFAVKGY